MSTLMFFLSLSLVDVLGRRSSCVASLGAVRDRHVAVTKHDLPITPVIAGLIVVRDVLLVHIHNLSGILRGCV